MSQTLLVYKEEKRFMPKAATFCISKLQDFRIEVLNFSLFLAVILLVILHLALANSIAITDYGAKSARKSADNLQVEIRNLNLELTKTRSVSFLKEMSGTLNLVANDSIQYIQSLPDTVALNQ